MEIPIYITMANPELYEKKITVKYEGIPTLPADVSKARSVRNSHLPETLQEPIFGL